MKKILALIFLFAPSCDFAQDVAQDSAWLVTHYVKIERTISARDGVKLFTAIYLPNDSTTDHPILMKRTPYSCGPYGENKFDSWWKTPYMAYFKENFIVVIQDVRGRFMSEGNFEDVRPFIPDKKSAMQTDESTDAYDAIDWLIKNVPHNNGKVGIYGISYPGFYATMAALSNHPALKAVSPQAPVTDWFIGDDFHHKGVPFILDAFDFYREFGVPRRQPSSERPKIPSVIHDDNYRFFLESGTYDEIKRKYMGDSIKFWNDVAAHPNYDAWWQARDTRTHCYNIKPAILVVGGLFDAEDCYGGWNLYKAIEAQSPTTNCKIIEGPWFHGGLGEVQRGVFR
jgi:putative CocE/NonD family hydrolase